MSEDPEDIALNIVRVVLTIAVFGYVIILIADVAMGQISDSRFAYLIPTTVKTWVLAVTLISVGSAVALYRWLFGQTRNVRFR